MDQTSSQCKSVGHVRVFAAGRLRRVGTAQGEGLGPQLWQCLRTRRLAGLWAGSDSRAGGGSRPFPWARLDGIVTGLDYAEPALDEIVAGKYRLTRLIGRGGMGSVWEGVHLTLGSRVAVKFIEPTYAESPEARQRFENEARAAARLNSKYAVQVYDHGMMPDGRPFIVMEFLTGEPLDARLEREGRISPAETAQIISQVCRALSRAHTAGIVHRDLKPENIFLVWDEEDQSNVAKVVDFGIAKFTDNQIGISSSTRTGSVLGTPFYMSPEQARGLRTVDYRTDLWSLGVIAYRCIVGRLPFEGESLGDLLVKICTFPIPVPSQATPGCPPQFDAWFARALEREPSARFVTAQELAEQLMLACGVAAGRQAFASGALGQFAEPSLRAGGYVPGNATPGGGVAGVTGASVKTDTAFSHTRQGTLGAKNRAALWIIGASLGLVGLVAVGALLVIRRQPADDQHLERDASVASSAGSSLAVGGPSVRSASPEAASADPTVVVEPATSVQDAPQLAPSNKPAVAAAPRTPAPRATAPVAPIQPPQPAPTARRPGNSRPIDVGY